MPDNFTLLNMFNHVLISKNYDSHRRKLYVSVNSALLSEIRKNAGDVVPDDVLNYLKTYRGQYNNLSVEHLNSLIRAIREFYLEFLQMNLELNDSLLTEAFSPIESDSKKSA